MTALAEVTGQYVDLPITTLARHPANRKIDPLRLTSLEESIRVHGLLTPIIVRPRGDSGHQILGGERRYLAARNVGLETVPCVVRDADDREALAILTVDNIEHEDYHPLDEARAYRELMKLGDSAQQIAARIQKSKKYVYDRVKLLELIPALQELFRDGKITAGHAILLARETKETQQLVLAQDAAGRWEHNQALFISDSLDEPEESEPELFLDEQIEKGGDILRPVSVRQLRRFLDTHARLDPARADIADLFPDTAGVLQEAKQAEIPVVHITREHFVRPEAKIEGQRTYGPNSWKRADDVDGEPPCEYAVAGVIVVGPGRGHGFPVCVTKDRCRIHWPDHVDARLKREAERAAQPNGGKRATANDEEARTDRAHEKHAAAERQRAAVSRRFASARGPILDALVGAISKASVTTGAESALGKLILGELDEELGSSRVLAKKMPAGKTPAEFLRYLALQLCGRSLDGSWNHFDEYEIDQITKRCRSVGVDVRALIEEHAPGQEVQTSAQKKEAKR